MSGINRQPTEEEFVIADALQELKLLISQTNITDEDFQEKIKMETLPKMKTIINEMEKQLS
jgi:hypothetical protein